MKHQSIQDALKEADKSFHPSTTELFYTLKTLKDAALNWAVVEWMHEQGFAHTYKLELILEEWKNFKDAYLRELEERNA